MTNKSPEALAMLRYIDNHDPDIDDLMKRDNRYLRPLLNPDNPLAIRRGSKLIISSEGREYLSRCNSASPPTRKHVGDLSPTVEALLHLSNLRQMRRKAS
jgi:hypothetical protein